MPYLVDKSDIKKHLKVRSFKAFPYGILSIVTYLNKLVSKKVNIDILDLNLSNDYIESLAMKVTEFNPDVVGISMMFDSSYKYLSNITNTIKQISSNVIILMGGSSATSSYKEILKEQTDIDGICYSEGELPFLRLVKSADILSFLDEDPAWITRNSINKIPCTSHIKNLDEVIKIDYSLINYSKYQMEEAFSPFSNNIIDKKQFFLFTSRGCKFKCFFCIHSAHSDKTIRYASVNEVIDHVKYLVDNYHMNVLTIYDDQLLFNRNRAKTIFRELAQFNIRVECPNGLSPAFIDEEMAHLMKHAGMDTIYLAIESGSPFVLNNIIQKPLKLDKIEPVISFLRKNNFWIQGFFVSGLPGETDEHRNETLNFIKNSGLDWASFSLAIPSRGSKLYNHCIENGYIEKNLPLGEIDVNKYIIKTPEYSPEYIIKQTYTMNLAVNFVNNYRLKRNEYIVSSLCFKDILKRYPNHAFAHYYLAQSLKGMNDDPEIIKFHEDKFFQISKVEPEWKEYAEYFKLAWLQ